MVAEQPCVVENPQESNLDNYAQQHQPYPLSPDIHQQAYSMIPTVDQPTYSITQNDIAEYEHLDNCHISEVLNNNSTTTDSVIESQDYQNSIPVNTDCDVQSEPVYNDCDNGKCSESELEPFPSNSDLSDTSSACSDPYGNSDYTDSVCSANSATFLLPKQNANQDIAISIQDVDSNDNAQSVPDKVVDSYENKEYTDSVSSHASSTQPLIYKSSSLWSFVKEVEISAPVIGLIDHPGFISSQRDLSSTSNLSFACQKALKYLNDERVASSLLLPGSVKDISKLPPEDKSFLPDLDHNIVPSGRHTRNLIFLSVCNMMVFLACGSIRNLQSSINHEGGVGITALAVSCFGFMVGSIFSPFFVQTFAPYRCLIASLVPHMIYIAANFYPVMWLMVPVSLLQGVSGAIWWNAMSTYVTFLAKGYSEKHKKDYEGVLSKFFGIFCLMFQMYMIFGNLIASLVLTYANPVPTDITNSTMNMTSNSSMIYEPVESMSPESLYSMSAEPVIFNSTSPSSSNTSYLSLCGANYCHHYTISNTGTAVSDFAKYLLFGIYIACVIICLLIVVFLLEPLNKRLFSSTVISCSMVKSQTASIARFCVNRKFLLLTPLLIFSSMEQGFATAEITKAFVTCPIGVHMVGYTMICMGVSASFSAYLSGWLNRFLGRTVLIASAVVCNLALLAVMAVWSPTPESLIVIFVLIGLWGLADGIWLAQTNSLMGVLFPEDFEEAFTGLRIMQGMGSMIAFAYAQVFCMATKIYIMVTVVVVGMVCYLVSEHLLKKEMRLKAKVVDIKTEEV